MLQIRFMLFGAQITQVVFSVHKLQIQVSFVIIYTFKIYNEKDAFFHRLVIKIALFSSTDYNIPVTRPSGLYNVYLLRYCTVHRGEIYHLYVRLTIATEVNRPDKKLVNSTSVQWLNLQQLIKVKQVPRSTLVLDRNIQSFFYLILLFNQTDL